MKLFANFDTKTGEIYAVCSQLVGLPDKANFVEVDEGVDIGYIRQPDGSFKAPAVEPPSAEEVIRQAHDQINAIADLIYTSSTSLDRRYANKRRESHRFIDAGRPSEITEAEYPYLFKEARAREVEPSVLADLIISMASGFDAFGSDAEEARAAVTVAVNKADPDQRQSAAQAIVDDLKANAEALA